jgi:hypothetical protein
VPFDAAEFAIDADIEVVFLADGDLGRVEDAFGSVFEAEEDIGVIVEEAAIDERSDVGGEFRDLEAGDVFREVFGVGTDVADAATGTAL